MTTSIFLIYLAVFLLLSTAILLVSGIDKEIAEEYRRGRKAEMLRFRKLTPIGKLVRLEQKRRKLVKDARIPKPVYRLLTGLGALGGAVIGKVFFQEPFFAVLIGILGALGPLLFLSYKLTQSKSERVDKLRASMMLLSGSYIVTEDFVKSVQDNIDLLEYPAPFREFLTYVSLIDGSVKTGLRRMENQVENLYFSQWIDVLIMAQDDRSLKYVTMSVVDAMNDVHQAQRESDTVMYAIWREYFTVLILIFAAPLIFRVLMKPAYTVLVTTLPGQVLLAILLAAVVYSLIKAVRLNKPLLV
ncbi:MAG: hypothetical protein VB064_01825 [Oscillospiraceae bacterium]|nr:hypothetical protein [Oscillospiraceae bacterium]